MGRKTKPNPSPETGNWLLPSISRTMHLIGAPRDIRESIRGLERELDGKHVDATLPDDKTLRRGEQMSPSSQRRAMEFMAEAISVLGWDMSGFESPQDRQDELKGRTRNVLYWRCAMRGLRQSSGGEKFAPVVEWVEQRCDLEDALFTEVLGRVDQPKAAAAHLRRGLQQHTSIPKEYLGAAVDQLVAAGLAQKEDGRAGVRLTPELARLLLWMHWDPMLQLAAVAESRLIQSDGEDATGDRPFLAHILPRWEGGELILPPERYFDCLRHNFSRREGLDATLGKRKFAEYLPEPGLSPRLNSAPADPGDSTKYQQLRHWITGRRPSNEGFDALMQNLGMNAEESGQWRFLMQVSYALDEELRRWIEGSQNWPLEVAPVFGELFRRYPSYVSAMKTPDSF